MKMTRKFFLFAICILCISGCGKDNNSGRKMDNGNSVDKVINEQIANAEQEESSTDEQRSETLVSECQETESEGTVDYDLTEMGSDMVYATVYQMMVAPEQYVGKTFRMDGTYYATYYEPTEKYYHYCVIQDATACCAQGMEFVWGDGSHVYPDEYPSENTEIVVEGTFETYTEDGDSNLYCRLKDSILQEK